MAKPAAPAPLEPDLGQPEDFQFRVLLGVPEATTIPIFALGVEAARAAVETELTFATTPALSRLLNGNLARAIPGRPGECRLMRTRRRIGRRNAVYATWLAFPDVLQAQALVGDYPRLGLIAITTEIVSEITTRNEALQAAAAKGRFNLGPLEHRARINRAQEYVREAEALEKLRWSHYGLRALRESLAVVPDEVSVG